MEEYSREPCPWRIVDDCGGAFTMGAIGGAVFQSIKGFRNAPSGFNRRLIVRFLFKCTFKILNEDIASANLSDSYLVARDSTVAAD